MTEDQKQVRPQAQEMQEQEFKQDIKQEFSEMVIDLTKSQVELLNAANRDAQQASNRVQLVISGIFAGADISQGQITGFDPEARRITVRVPREENTE